MGHLVGRLEDDLVCDFGKWLRERGVLVLVQSANQGAAFVFRPKPGVRKAPDVVFLCGNILAIFEAKLKTADLFGEPQGRLSDFGALALLNKLKDEQTALLEEAGRRLSTLGRGLPSEATIVTGLLSEEGFKGYIPRLRSEQVAAISYDGQSKSPTIETGPESLCTELASLKLRS